jgi:hypothetical protein
MDDRMVELGYCRKKSINISMISGKPPIRVHEVKPFDDSLAPNTFSPPSVAALPDQWHVYCSSPRRQISRRLGDVPQTA